MKTLKNEQTSIVELFFAEVHNISQTGTIIDFDYPSCYLRKLFDCGARFWAIKASDKVIALGMFSFCDKEGDLVADNANFAVLNDWTNLGYYKHKSLSLLVYKRTKLVLKKGVYNIIGYLRSESMEIFWKNGFSLKGLCDHEGHIVNKFIYSNWLNICFYRLQNLFT